MQPVPELTGTGHFISSCPGDPGVVSHSGPTDGTRRSNRAERRACSSTIRVTLLLVLDDVLAIAQRVFCAHSLFSSVARLRPGADVVNTLWVARFTISAKLSRRTGTMHDPEPVSAVSRQQTTSVVIVACGGATAVHPTPTAHTACNGIAAR